MSLTTFSEQIAAGSSGKGPFNVRFIITAFGIAMLGGISVGFDTTVIVGVIPYISGYFKLDEWGVGRLVALMLLGCAIGALAGGWLADRFGRRNTLIACTLLFGIAGIGAGRVHSLEWLTFFRTLGGLGIGTVAMLSPMYIAELTPADQRGKLVSFYQLSIVLGILFAYLSNGILSGMGEDNWRWMLRLQALPSLCFGLLLITLPESPRYLIKSGNTIKASYVLIKMYGNFEVAKKEYLAIEKSYLLKTDITLSDIFEDPYKTLLVSGILVAVFQQVTGINIILYYAPVILTEMGVTASSAAMHITGIGMVIVFTSFIVAIGLIDKFGRKKLLLIGIVIMGISLCTLAVCFYFKYFSNNIALACLLLYVGAFSGSLGTVTWVYLSEIFPNHARAVLMSLSTLCLWLADFVVSISFPMLAKQLSTAGILLVYAIMCGVAFFVIRKKVWETMGHSLEEIEIHTGNIGNSN